MPTKIRRGRTITLIHPILAWRLKSKSVGKQGYGRDGQQLHMPERISGGIIEKCRPNQSQYMSSSAMRRASLSLQIQIVFLFVFLRATAFFSLGELFLQNRFRRRTNQTLQYWGKNSHQMKTPSCRYFAMLRRMGHLTPNWWAVPRGFTRMPRRARASLVSVAFDGNSICDHQNVTMWFRKPGSIVGSPSGYLHTGGAKSTTRENTGDATADRKEKRWTMIVKNESSSHSSTTPHQVITN